MTVFEPFFWSYSLPTSVSTDGGGLDIRTPPFLIDVENMQILSAMWFCPNCLPPSPRQVGETGSVACSIVTAIDLA